MPANVKGRFTLYDSEESRDFMFNPNMIVDGKPATFGVVSIGGSSHPIYQFGSGDEHAISFELYLDGDRGRVGKVRDTLSIADDLNWYKSLTYPDTYNNGIAAVAPQKVLWTFGNYATSVLVIVVSAQINVTMFTPDLDPVRATIAIELKEIVTRYRTAADIRNPPLSIRRRRS